MNSKIYYLLQDLKDNFSHDLLAETLDCLDNDKVNFFENVQKSKELLNDQPTDFYLKLAESFADDLEYSPEMYFLVWEPLLSFFNQNTLFLFFENCRTVGENETVIDFVSGLKELQEGKPEIALFHFNRIQNYFICYFIALCYYDLENFENAIRNNLKFIKNFQDVVENIKTKGMELSTDPNYQITVWNVHSDLGYLYNRIGDFQSARSEYDYATDIFSLEEIFLFTNNSEQLNDFANEFTVFINNYLLALERTNCYSRCLEVLDFVLSKEPNNNYYSQQATKFKERQERHSFADEVINRLFKVKRPYNIDHFQETKLIAKEKALEDMIVEQIRYGFEVFGKKLEVYQDDEIYGRQYYIPEVNGILDLLLIERATNTLYVVELKRNTGGTEVLYQIERYISGLKGQLQQKIRGIICVHKSNQALRELVANSPDIELYTYNFSFYKE